MGHSRMGVLPGTRKWRQVIELIAGGADVEDIPAATAKAAEASLVEASRDPAIRRSVWLLTQIPLAARTDDFAGTLRDLGLDVSSSPSLVEIGTGLMNAVDRYVQHTGGRSDFGEMAQISAVESLHAVTAREMLEFMGPAYAGENARRALAGLATQKQFALLARDFFARLTRRYLDYYLSRELPQHVGVKARFHSLRQLQEFEGALDLHCYQTTLIIRDFAGRWFKRADFEGDIDPVKAGNFAHVAFDKIRKELVHRRHAA